MSHKHLQLKPHAIKGTKTAWFYEEDAGLVVVVEPAHDVTQLTIPWNTIRSALARKDKP